MSYSIKGSIYIVTTWIILFLLTYTVFAYLTPQDATISAQPVYFPYFITFGSIFFGIGAGVSFFFSWRNINYINNNIKEMRESQNIEKTLPVVGEDSFATLCEQVNQLIHASVTNTENMELKIRARTKKLYERINQLEARILERENDKKILIKNNEYLNKMVNYDSITNLPGRILFNQQLNDLISEANKNKRLFAVLIINIDNFKYINDDLGRALGDAVLLQLADCLKANVRSNDLLARTGGGEFTIVLHDIVHSEFAMLVADKILNINQVPLNIDGKVIHLILNIGISVYPEDGDSIEKLMTNADIAMFKTKSLQKSTVQRYHKTVGASVTEHSKLAIILQKAITNEEFVLYYQPKVNLIEGTVVGIEAFLRWESSKLGLITPPTFLKVAEETGHIMELGEWVLKKACITNKLWQQQGLAPVPIAVNLSNYQLFYQDVVTLIKKSLEEAALDEKYLDIEINSKIFSKLNKDEINKLNKIGETGVGITIDKFGREPFSISMLKELPIKSIIIDKSIIKNIPYQVEEVEMALAIMDLAGRLNLTVAANGIETIEQLKFLVKNQCHIGQGYFLSKDLPEKDFVSNGYFISPQFNFSS